MASTKNSKARVALSKKQLQSVLGAELFSLCQGIAADGILSKDEIVVLGQWLTDHHNDELLGIALLTDTLKHIVADGRVSRLEQQQLLEVVEQILPPDERRNAKAARRAVERERKAAERKQRDLVNAKQRAEARLREPEDEFDFMIAGVHFDGRARTIKESVYVGDRVHLNRDAHNPRDEYAVAITVRDGRQIGYVPRTESQDVASCLDDHEYYVASIKKVLTGGHVPIPVVLLHFYGQEQFVGVRQLNPDRCESATMVPQARVVSFPRTSDPWWKLW